MRSVYAKILVWCFATLLLSLMALGMVSQLILTQMVGKGSFFDRINDLLLVQASEAFESGGAPKLTSLLKRADRTLGGEHHLIDIRGKDLATGEDLSRLAAEFRFEKGAIQPFGDKVVAGVESPDKRYRMLAVADSPFRLRFYLPYYMLILAGVAVLCWALASRIASPLRDLTRAVERFGQGDLSARVNSRRRDELGELSAAFDLMAERIGTLLMAERRLLQDVSHELRSPLARLSFAAELVRTDPNHEAVVARLKKEVQRLNSLVGTLIEATRAEGDPHTVVRKPESVNLLVEDVVADCQLGADVRGCRIALQQEVQAVVDADHELLRRAFENVLRNAIRHSPEGSQVDVTIGAEGDSIRITVRDSGPGVPEEMLKRIFDPFRRVDDSRSSATGGMGLGLTITARAIQLHEGGVWAENAHPGLRVCFQLPADSRSPEIIKAVRTPAKPDRSG